jgi:cytochrome c peroxidase
VINLGYTDIPNMFWDGRVERDPKTGVLRTPEPSLNGENPKYPEITRELKSALSAQVIFPIVNGLEMMGENNDVADAGDNIKAWEAVVDRLIKGEGKERYLEQFNKAFGAAKYNIGHLGEALGTFLGANFNLVDTPYDRYLKGDLKAMTTSEKKGLKVFLTRGKCINCHNGKHLSDFKFKTVAVPQFNSDVIKAPYDQGRFEVTGDKSDLFKFRTPSIRNLAVTAPYMHTGGMATIEEVVDHYDNVKKGLENFDLSKVDLSMYKDNFVMDKDPIRNKLRVNLISIGEVRRGLNFTNDEREDLINFLKTGLLDYRLQRDRVPVEGFNIGRL